MVSDAWITTIRRLRLLLLVSIMWAFGGFVVLGDSGGQLPIDLIPITIENANELEELVKIDYGNPSTVYEVAWSPDGSILAVGGAVGIFLYEDLDFDMARQLDSPPSTSFAFNADGRLLASADGNFVHLWDLETEVELAVMDHTAATQVAFSPVSSLLASGSGDGRISLWTDTYTEIDRLDSGFDNAVVDLAFSPDGTLLASANQDGIHLWDIDDVVLSHTTEPITQSTVLHLQSVWAVAFSPEDALLAAGNWGWNNDDSTLSLWDVGDYSQIASLPGHSEVTTDLVFSPDGNILASAGADNIVRLWDVETLSELVDLQGHSDQIWSVAFNSDQTILASAGQDGTVRLWGIPADRSPLCRDDIKPD